MKIGSYQTERNQVEKGRIPVKVYSSNEEIYSTMACCAVSFGVRQILSARQVRLGVFRDGPRAIFRRAVFDSIPASFPATLILRHPHALIMANASAAARLF